MTEYIKYTNNSLKRICGYVALNAFKIGDKLQCIKDIDKLKSGESVTISDKLFHTIWYQGSSEGEAPLAHSVLCKYFRKI